ncbi:helix-turn-helix domain-containing protein [Geothermobacter hydrogeniphilus]|uniref:Transcriptional regulator n=1 Tax=Geothermobacter hydrogeniphilus TaxID=1969733 RepID=A0A1X0Y228_9BACT|nr:helix-turn-helix domain-containing protein [Geothermobacter hydrogeniphilus]ORJ59261.1 transcriptional regulator [Geothermobacter hydrogeniphilus]
MSENVLKIGIMSREDYKQRTIAIARGTYTPKRNEPKIWFESLQSMAQVLSSENQRLLRLIMDEHPQSLKELEELTGRTSSNLSRTLKTMAHYGIVELEKHKRRLVPKVKTSDFRVEFGIRQQSH